MTSQYDPKHVILVDTFGNFLSPDGLYTVALEYSDGMVVYQGEATPGTGKGAALWRIKKLTYSGTNVTDIQWADGVNSFTKVWNDRATYTYS